MADVAQRWRVVYERGDAARALAQRAELEAWEAALLASGLPIARSGSEGSRPRLGMPPPLPTGLTADNELLDIHLAERRTVSAVRGRLGAVMPVGHALRDVFDVWVGAPPLPAQVVALDYALVVGEVEDTDALEKAALALLRAPRLERTRRRGERETRYDLRPSIKEISIEPSATSGACLVRLHLAVHPEHGATRPDEVIAALGEELGRPIEMLRGARTRIWTADESPDGRDRGPSGGA